MPVNLPQGGEEADVSSHRAEGLGFPLWGCTGDSRASCGENGIHVAARETAALV